MKYLGILIAFWAVPIFALQAQSNRTKSDPEAKKILDAASKKFKSFTSLKGHFTFATLDHSDKEQSVEEGNFVIKGQKFYIKQGGQQISSNGVTLWDYNEEMNEVTISKLKDAGSTITPQKLFTNFYDKDYWYKLNDIEKPNSKYHEIELTPKDKSLPFYKAYVYIDKTTKLITSTKVYENGGGRFLYSFSKLEQNKPVDETLFTFDKSKHPKVETIDLQ